jgi:hypothetical protein
VISGKASPALTGEAEAMPDVRVRAQDTNRAIIIPFFPISEPPTESVYVENRFKGITLLASKGIAALQGLMTSKPTYINPFLSLVNSITGVHAPPLPPELRRCIALL